MVGAVAQHLDTATIRVDYGKRREALKAWSMSPEEWHALTSLLFQRPTEVHHTPGPLSGSMTDTPLEERRLEQLPF